MTTPLAYFVGTYLHQDWVDDYGDLRGVVADFKAHEPESLRNQVVDEIDAVLQRYPNEAQLRSLLIDEWGSNYRAEADGQTYRQWLALLADLFIAS